MHATALQGKTKHKTTHQYRKGQVRPSLVNKHCTNLDCTEASASKSLMAKLEAKLQGHCAATPSKPKEITQFNTKSALSDVPAASMAKRASIAGETKLRDNIARMSFARRWLKPVAALAAVPVLAVSLDHRMYWFMFELVPPWH